MRALGMRESQGATRRTESADTGALVGRRGWRSEREGEGAARTGEREEEEGETAQA